MAKSSVVTTSRQPLVTRQRPEGEFSDSVLDRHIRTDSSSIHEPPGGRFGLRANGRRADEEVEAGPSKLNHARERSDASQTSPNKWRTISGTPRANMVTGHSISHSSSDMANKRRRMDDTKDETPIDDHKHPRSSSSFMERGRPFSRPIKRSSPAPIDESSASEAPEPLEDQHDKEDIYGPDGPYREELDEEGITVLSSIRSAGDPAPHGRQVRLKKSHEAVVSQKFRKVRS